MADGGDGGERTTTTTAERQDAVLTTRSLGPFQTPPQGPTGESFGAWALIHGTAQLVIVLDVPLSSFNTFSVLFSQAFQDLISPIVISD